MGSNLWQFVCVCLLIVCRYKFISCKLREETQGGSFGGEHSILLTDAGMFKQSLPLSAALQGPFTQGHQQTWVPSFVKIPWAPLFWGTARCSRIILNEFDSFRSCFFPGVVSPECTCCYWALLLLVLLSTQSQEFVCVCTLVHLPA